MRRPGSGGSGIGGRVGFRFGVGLALALAPIAAACLWDSETQRYQFRFQHYLRLRSFDDYVVEPTLIGPHRIQLEAWVAVGLLGLLAAFIAITRSRRATDRDDSSAEVPFRRRVLLSTALFVFSLIAGGILEPLVRPLTDASLAIPLPHAYPRVDGGLPLRLRDVEAVLTDDFPRHTAQWYRQRNERARKQVDAVLTFANSGPAQKLAELAPFDDLAVGLDRVGAAAEGVEILRKKLELQRRWKVPPEVDELERLPPPSFHAMIGRTGRSERAAALTPDVDSLYRTHANLGTLIVHANMKLALNGDKAARANVAVGLSHLYRAVAINPDAHFGREVWQIAIIEHLVCSLDDPERLVRQDFLGHGLKGGPRFGRLHDGSLDAAFVRREVASPRSGERSRRRSAIALLGPATEERLRFRPPPSSQPGPADLIPDVPFDQPTLGILGMWTQGGGENPHFAVALGNIMSRVGQLRLAHFAYQRADATADRVHPDPDIRRKFREAVQNQTSWVQGHLSADTAVPPVPRPISNDLFEQFKTLRQSAADRRERSEAAELEALAAGEGAFESMSQAEAASDAERPKEWDRDPDLLMLTPTQGQRQLVSVINVGVVSLSLFALLQALAYRRHWRLGG